MRVRNGARIWLWRISVVMRLGLDDQSGLNQFGAPIQMALVSLSSAICPSIGPLDQSEEMGGGWISVGEAVRSRRTFRLAVFQPSDLAIERSAVQAKANLSVLNQKKQKAIAAFVARIARIGPRPLPMSIVLSVSRQDAAEAIWNNSCESDGLDHQGAGGALGRGG
jgi:hypothetical protein